MLKDTKKIHIGTLSATGVLSLGISVKDYKNCIVEIATTGSANMTFKFQQSAYNPIDPDTTAPNFATAASYTNRWAYVESYDNNNSSTNIVGSTGVSLTGSDIVAYYVINTNNMMWFDIVVTAYSAGTIDAYLIETNNA